jgi:arylesterase/paraoxonase
MRRLYRLGGAVVILIAVFVGYTVWLAGEFKSLEPHFGGSCKAIGGPVGTEDITIHPATGIAYISSEDRRATIAGTPTQGGIWSYDLNVADARPVNLTTDLKFPFHPHGIGLLPIGDGGELMVVNHRRGGIEGAFEDTIEVFAIEGAALKHIRTIRSDLLLSANDVVPVGGGRFYASIDHGNPSGILRTIEDYARLPLAHVVYYDTVRFRKFADGIRYANGINLSREGSTLYVAGSTDRVIHVFTRTDINGFLIANGQIETGTGVDNIEFDSDGTLWVGAHPKMLTFVGHSKDADKLSPSQVLNIDPVTGNVEEIFLSDGSDISGSSVAAKYNQRLLIGAVFDKKFLDCELPG